MRSVLYVKGNVVQYWIETLGCPKNHVDSDKLAGLLESQGYVVATSPANADLVVANTCAFIEAAREESIETVLELADVQARERAPRRDGLHGRALRRRARGRPARSRPRRGIRREPDRIASTPVALRARPLPSFDLLNLPRPKTKAPWAYVKIAEGCDRRCGFCAIPTFRGDQRSRSTHDILARSARLVEGGVRELVLIAQDLASWGHDRRRVGRGERARGARRGRHATTDRTHPRPDGEVERVRLLYLYPSGLTEGLIETILATGVPYFDLSLQHASRPLLRAMRRWGDAARFLERIAAIRAVEPDATFRSSFILGYPGETEDDQRVLLDFVEAAQLDWAGFFTFSSEEGTYANDLDAPVPHELALERLREVERTPRRHHGAKARRAGGNDGRTAHRRPGGRRAACASVPRSMVSSMWHRALGWVPWSRARS